MTPGARVSAAIEIIDLVLMGTPAEQALTRWARGSRFAGSKDRAAVRDHVFDALRNLRSFAHLGGTRWPDTTGRAVMIGAMRAQDVGLADMFSGVGHAPDILSDDEAAPVTAPVDQDAWNLPDWLIPVFKDSLGQDAMAAADMLGTRAPISIRVNLRKTSRDDLQSELASYDIETRTNPLSASALTVLTRPRQLVQTQAYMDGRFELQDASSQAVVDRLDLEPGARVLDFCAGGGGKSLAVAMATGAQVWAHDIDERRMRDIPERAARAGADVKIVTDLAEVQQQFDLVLVDAPCSGSGSWRRSPDAKWRFTPDRLEELEAMQASVLQDAMRFVAPKGCLAYVTCSVFKPENSTRILSFLSENSGWTLKDEHVWHVSPDGDGFFLSLLIRA
ncbi:MAG: RsmB/NOP family class I SAM-dependent RNA methyltransferase [Aliishimia sp.]